MTLIGNTYPLIDSSVLIAFFNGTDDFSQMAKRLISNQETPVIVLSAIAHESLALIRKRVSKQVATQAANQLLNSPFFILQTSGQEIISESLALFIKKKAKYSFVDCLVITEAQLKKSSVLTFDKHFKDFDLKIIS